MPTNQQKSSMTTDELRAENEALKAKLDRISNILCPSVLGNDRRTWRAIIERQDRQVFNEYELIQRLGRSNGEKVRIIWLRYRDAVEALNGKEEANAN